MMRRAERKTEGGFRDSSHGENEEKKNACKELLYEETRHYRHCFLSVLDRPLWG